MDNKSNNDAINNVLKVEIVKKPFLKRVLSHPFRYYGRAGGFTFCLVAATNLFSTMFDDNRRQFFFEHPQLYTFGLVTKSAQFGILWPSFYVTALQDPYGAFVLGASIERSANELEKESK